MSLQCKKIAFYPILSYGHFNLCISLGQRLISLFEDLEVYFFVDKTWAEKLNKIEPRFKQLVYSIEGLEEDPVNNFVAKIEPIVKSNPLEQAILFFQFIKNSEFDFKRTDKSIFGLIQQIKPDLIMLDQLYLPPSVFKSKIPYVFVVSVMPYFLDLNRKNFIGSDAFLHETERIEEFRKNLIPIYDDTEAMFRKWYKEEGLVIEDNFKIYSIISKYFSIYCYPKEIDIFDDNYIKENRLFQIDTPVVSNRLNEPYKIPEEFALKQGKLIYISLGSLFSSYTSIYQKLIDNLASLPHKFIVSKGINGDKLKMPDNFIGENFLNQLSVLQVVDLIISHGGNNTVTECFYFGVPAIIAPCFLDQVNNMVRLVEKGFSLKKINLFNHTKEEIQDLVNQTLNNQELISKWKQASIEIQKNNKIDDCARYIYNFLNKSS